MKRYILTKLFIVCVFYSLLTSGCKKEVDTDYVYTGNVIDQITRQPISGASIWFGHRQFNETDIPVFQMSQSTLSDAEGRFTLNVPKEIINDYVRYPGPVIYAVDVSYVGSNILDVPKGGENMNLEMYHSSQLYLHVQNDTITNKIDSTKIWIKGDRVFWTYPGFIGRVIQANFPTDQFTCKGKDFDTVFIIRQLWGNLTYSVEGGNNYFFGPYYFSKNVKLIPDEINYLSVTF